MTLSVTELERWAQDGVDKLCEPYLKDPTLKIDIEEAKALLRAAYGLGYQEALTEPEVGDPVDAATKSQALVLMLPV